MEIPLPDRNVVEALPPGPVAVILAEDGAGLSASVAHCAALGFPARLVFRPPALALPEAADLVQIDAPPMGRTPAAALLTRLNPMLAGRWLHPAFNAEHLVFPWCETRTIRDLVAFMEEERRESVHGMTIDLYAEDLEAAPDGISHDRAGFDAIGYFGFSRTDEAGYPHAELRGGLRWRFESLIHPAQRRLDRPALYRARAGLEMTPALRLSDETMNALSCPWHRNVTAAILSFRAAKALLRNPISAAEVEGFVWEGTQRCDWSSDQLLRLGFIEAGQWF